MDFNGDELMTELYLENLRNKAIILTLKGMLTAYVALQNKAQGDALEGSFDQLSTTLYRELLLASPLKDDVLKLLSENALQQLKDELGL